MPTTNNNIVGPQPYTLYSEEDLQLLKDAYASDDWSTFFIGDKKYAPKDSANIPNIRKRYPSALTAKQKQWNEANYNLGDNFGGAIVGYIEQKYPDTQFTDLPASAQQLVGVATYNEALSERRMPQEWHHLYGNEELNDVISYYEKISAPIDYGKMLADLRAHILPRYTEESNKRAKSNQEMLNKYYSINGQGRYATMLEPPTSLPSTEENDYQLAASFLDDAERTMKASTNKEGFLSGFKRNLFSEETFSLGLNQVSENNRVNEILSKADNDVDSLTESEQAVLDAFILQQAISAGFPVSDAYQWGQGFADVVPYIADFVLTRGIVRLGAKAGAKATMSQLPEGLTKYLTKKAASLGKNRFMRWSAKGLGEMSTAAAMLPLQPSTYRGITDRRIGDINIALDEEGKLAYDGRTVDEDGTKKALTDNYINNITESLGGTILGKAFGALSRPAAKIGNRIAPKLSGKWSNAQRLLRETGWDGVLRGLGQDGFPIEWLEEIMATTGNALFVGDYSFDPDSPNYAYSQQNLTDTAVITALTSLFMSGASGLAYKHHVNILRDNQREAEEKILARYSVAEVKKLTEIASRDPESLSSWLNPLRDRLQEIHSQRTAIFQGISPEARRIMADPYATEADRATITQQDKEAIAKLLALESSYADLAAQFNFVSTTAQYSALKDGLQQHAAQLAEEQEKQRRELSIDGTHIVEIIDKNTGEKGILTHGELTGDQLTGAIYRAQFYAPDGSPVSRQVHPADIEIVGISAISLPQAQGIYSPTDNTTQQAVNQEQLPNPTTEPATPAVSAPANDSAIGEVPQGEGVQEIGEDNSPSVSRSDIGGVVEDRGGLIDEGVNTPSPEAVSPSVSRSDIGGVVEDRGGLIDEGVNNNEPTPVGLNAPNGSTQSPDQLSETDFDTHIDTLSAGDAIQAITQRRGPEEADQYAAWRRNQLVKQQQEAREELSADTDSFDAAQYTNYAEMKNAEREFNTQREAKRAQLQHIIDSTTAEIADIDRYLAQQNRTLATEQPEAAPTAPTAPAALNSSTPSTEAVSPSVSRSDIGGVVEDRGGLIDGGVNNNEPTPVGLNAPNGANGATQSTISAQAKLAHIASWQQAINAPIVIFHDISEVDNPQAIANIQAGYRMPGWYNNGSVYIYLPHILDARDIDETILHEGIAHLGIRKLFRNEDKTNHFFDNVYRSMSAADKRKYSRYPGVSNLTGIEAKRAAADEYIAHLAETINLQQNLHPQQKSTWGKLIAWIRNTLNNIGIHISIRDKDIENILLSSYNKLKKNNERPQETTPDNALDANEVAVTLPSNGTETRFSIRSFREEGRAKVSNWLNGRVKSRRITKQEAQDILDQLDTIYDICQEYTTQYAPFGDWSEAQVNVDANGNPVLSVIKSNGEYAMNLDFSLVCKKRRTLDAVFQEMIARDIINDFELDGVQVAKINEIIRSYGFETACRLCFVDAKRFRIAAVADTFVELFNEISSMSDRKLRQVIKEEPTTVRGETAQLLLNDPSQRIKVSRSDFMSAEGFERIKRDYPEIMKLYNAKKGTGGPKASFGDVQYLNEIEKRHQWTPNKAYSVGGVRLQSFSDYVPRMVFDYVQMIADLAAKRLPVHAYTKEDIFAKQFGLTGIKINLSLVPRVDSDGIAPGLDRDGNYVWQEGETFPYDTAIAIQNAPGYRDNCGTIAVGVSDAHILKMLDDENIRMVIPYHKSGLNPAVAIFNNIDAFVDYTNEQNTRYESGSKLSKEDSKNHFNFNEALRKANGNPRIAAQQYLDWCRDNNYLPKFDKFASHPNYYKLLEDFTTMYTVDGVDTVVPQHAVEMRFPTEQDAFGSMRNLIAEGLEADAILEGQRNEQLSAIVDEIAATLPPKTKAKTKTKTQDTRFRIGDNEQTALLNAKQPKTSQPLIDTAISDTRFRVTKRTRETIDTWLNKRTDLDNAERNAFWTYIENEEPAKQLAMGKWFANGAIRLPEDQPTVDDAMRMARKMNVDPLKYEAPGLITSEYNERFGTQEQKEKLLSPDDERFAGILTDKVDYGNGITVYTVQDDAVGQDAVRTLMNDHLGRNFNCWCLLYADANGNITESARNTYWKHYDSIPKRVAFKDGKICSFCASDNRQTQWWDLSDRSHGDNIPVEMELPGDAYNRRSLFEFSETSNEFSLVKNYPIFRGNKKNGRYEEWYNEDTHSLAIRANFKGGKIEGRYEVWFENGQPRVRANYKDVVREGLYEEWYENGQPKLRANYKDGERDGLYEEWYKNGQLSMRADYKNGRKDGSFEEWYKNGQLSRRADYKGGLYEEWYENGQPSVRANYKGGERDGLYEEWYENGQLSMRANYKDDEFDGLYEEWYENGQIQEQTTFKYGKRNGTRTLWYLNGQIQEQSNYLNDHLDGFNFSWDTKGNIKEINKFEKDYLLYKYGFINGEIATRMIIGYVSFRDYYITPEINKTALKISRDDSFLKHLNNKYFNRIYLREVFVDGYRYAVGVYNTNGDLLEAFGNTSYLDDAPSILPEKDIIPTGQTSFRSISPDESLTDYARAVVSNTQSPTGLNASVALATANDKNKLPGTPIRFRIKQHSRDRIPNVRGGWTEKKILRYLKENPTRSGVVAAANAIADFDSPQELKEHMFYHGTANGSDKLTPSIAMSDRAFNQIGGGGGYGLKYWGISVSRSKEISSSFSTKPYVRIYPIILLKDAKVIERQDFTDARDVEDHIVELWNEGVDAVWIGEGKQGKGEQELLILNPRAIVNVGTPDTYKYYKLGSAENPLNIADDQKIKEIYDESIKFVNTHQPQKPIKPARPSILLPQEQYAVEMEQYEKDLAQWEQKIEEYNNSPEKKAFDQALYDAKNTIRFRSIISEAESEVNTNPTKAQKEAGNYKKGHIRIGTFDITIEQPQGSIRRGVDANSKAWESKMYNTYGYIRGTEGVDGDHIDVFLANDMDSWNGEQVFVVDQYNEDSTFDEHKVMLGFNDINDAETAYLSNYEKDWAQKHHIVISATTTDDFKRWIDSSHRKTKAFADYKSVKTTEGQATSDKPTRFRAINPGESLTDYARAVVVNSQQASTPTGINTPVALATANDKNKLPDTPIRYRMTRRTESTVTGWINRRTDLTPDERKAVIDHIDNLDGTTLQLATAKWFAQGTIRIPEDNIQVEQAIKVASRAKVDPLAYDYPQAIISAFPDMKPKGKPINPDDVPTLTNKQELPNDIVVYDVDNSEESMRNMREIINTHLGIDANPWCILQANKDGILTDTAHRLWRTGYNSLPRRAAFRNGRLIAFFATGNSTQPIWWDRQDLPHIGIPCGREAMNDGSGRYIYNFFNEETGEIYHEKPHLGNRQDGIYREWDNNGNLIEESHYSNGRLNGIQKQWDYTRNTQHPDYTETSYVDGNTDGYQISKDWLSNKGLYITSFATIRNGSLHGIAAESAMRSYSSYVINNNFVSQEEWETYLKDHPEEKEWFNEAVSHNPISSDDDADTADDVINTQSGTRFRVVEDADTKERFDREIADGNFVKTYRSMVLIDGELYPPMFSKTEKGNKSNPGQLRQPSHEGDIEQSEEDLSKATLKNGKYYITLIKDNNKETRDVAYNPYLHTASSPLNDQFKEAQDRPNMVTVEMYIPISELTSGYQAEGAHDPVGWKPWPSGILRKYIDKPRKVLLTQRGMVHRIVPDSEVASLIDNDINGNLHTLPTNVFTPSVRAELEKLGYRFINTNNAGKITEGQFEGLTYSAAVAQDPEYFGYNPNPTPPKGGKSKDSTRFRFINWDKIPGYTQRDNGTRLSRRAKDAEDNGSFTPGKFRSTYGVSRRHFDILNNLGIIRNVGYHHTGANFTKSYFFAWADSNRYRNRYTPHSYAGGKVQEGSLAQRYASNKGAIDALLSQYEKEQWAYTPHAYGPVVPSFRDYIASIFPENYDEYLSPANIEARDKELQQTESMPEEARNVTQSNIYNKYKSIATQRYTDTQRDRLYNRYLDTYSNVMARAALAEQYNADIDNYNTSIVNSREHTLYNIYETLDVTPSYAQVYRLSTDSRPNMQGYRFRFIDGDNITDIAKAIVAENNRIDIAVANEQQLIPDMPPLRFRMSHRTAATAENWLNNRLDLSPAQRKAILNLIDQLDDTATQLATAKWYAQGTIRLPQDINLIKQAIETARRAKVDPLRYDFPMAIIAEFPDDSPTQPINPDTLSELHSKVDLPMGVSVYNVPDTPEAQQQCRDIINSHWGRNANPWCILSAIDGELTPQAKQWWYGYNAFPKRIAFRDGRLLAFFASDSMPIWWDRNNRPFSGIPVVSSPSMRTVMDEMSLDVTSYDAQGNIVSSAKATAPSQSIERSYVGENTTSSIEAIGDAYTQDIDNVAREIVEESVISHTDSPQTMAEKTLFRVKSIRDGSLITRDNSSIETFLDIDNKITHAYDINDTEHKRTALVEAHYDSMVRLKNLLDSLRKSGATINPQFDPYIMQNQAKSRAQAAIKLFDAQYRLPLYEAVTLCINDLSETNDLDNYLAISLYVQAKTALERQAVQVEKAKRENEELIKENPEAVVTDPEEHDYAGLAGVQFNIFSMWGAIDANVEKIKTNFNKLSLLAQEQDIPTVQEFVDMIEKHIGLPSTENSSAAQLWTAIVNISKFQLDTSFLAGITSRAGYQVLSYGSNIDAVIRERYQSHAKALRDDPGNYDYQDIFDDDGNLTERKKTLNDIAKNRLTQLAKEFADAIDAVPMPGKNGSWQYLIDTGWLTQEEVDNIHRYYQFYTPLKGHAELTAEDIVEYSSRTPRNQSKIKAVEGHTQLAKDPLNQLILDTHGVIHNAEENRWRRQLYNILSANPNTDQYVVQQRYYRISYDITGKKVYEPYGTVGFVNGENTFIPGIPSSEELANGTAVAYNNINTRAEVDIPIRNSQRSEHEVPVWVNGEAYTIFFYDKRIADACTGRNIKRPGQLWKRLNTLQFLNRIYAGLKTSLNPTFTLVSNIHRDIQEMLVNNAIDKGAAYAVDSFINRLRASYFGDIQAALRRYQRREMVSMKDANTRTEKLVMEFILNGGQVNITQLPDYDTAKVELQEDIEYYSRHGTLRTGNAVARAFNNMAERVELAPRLATYIASRNLGRSITESINDAKEVTVNFDRKGTWSGIMGLFQLFYNASAQSVRRQFDLARRHPMRFATTYALMMLTSTPIQLILSWLLSGADDDMEEIVKNYFSINPELRRHYNILIIGDTYIRIPRGVNFLPYVTLGDVVANMLLNPNYRPDTTKDVLDITSALLDTFTPSMVAQPIGFLFDAATADNHEEREHALKAAFGSALNRIPILEPLGQAIANYNFMGGTLYDNPYNRNDIAPSYTRARGYTQPVWVWASKALSDWTGGNVVKAGFLNIPPEAIENVMSIFGGWGEYGENVISLATEGIAAATGDTYDSEVFRKSFPLLSRLYGGNTTEQYNKSMQNLFYDDMTTLEQYENYKDRADEMDRREVFIEDYSADEHRYFADLATMSKIAKRLRTKVKNNTPQGENPKAYNDEELLNLYNLANEQYKSLSAGNYTPVDEPYYIYSYMHEAINNTPYRTPDGAYRMLDWAGVAGNNSNPREDEKYMLVKEMSREDKQQLTKIYRLYRKARKHYNDLPKGYYPGMPLDVKQQKIVDKFNESTRQLQELFDSTSIQSIISH